MGLVSDQKNTFTKILPPGKTIFLIFSVCVVTVHSWNIFVFLYTFPALLKTTKLDEIIGVFAYSLSFALFESICLTAIIITLIGIIPVKFLRERFLFYGTSLALIFSVWLILINLQGKNVQSWFFLQLIICILIIFMYSLLRPSQTKNTKSVADKLTVISSLFLSIDLFCIGVVIFRNLIRL